MQTISRRLPRAFVGAITAGLVAAGTVAVTAAPAAAAPDTDCMRAGIAKLKEIGALSAVAKDGVSISTAVTLGVAPRAGTDLSAVPDPVPFSVLLADHRAGADSLFVYPWC